VIGGLSRRLSKGLREDDPKRSELQMILSEAFRLEGIVEEFSRFFSINQISFKRADMNQLVNEAADDFSSQYRGESDFLLKRTLWNEPLNCTVDPDLLRRCLIHLFNNAREASDKSAHIEVATSRSDRDAIVDVTDSGKGMSRKVMDHAFDPFFSTKYQGTGIGLTFVHFVIKEHSGRIELKSEKGGGSRFRIRLPLEY
jgi:signal transduction histidine kinase